MYICGLMSCANKDSGAALIKTSDDPHAPPQYVAISEERLSRVKYGYYSPVRSIKYCMDAFGLTDIDQIDWFVTEWVGHKRFLNTNRSYRKVENDYIMSKLAIPSEKLVLAESHHLAHAASTFYASGFDEAAILIVDGLGSGMETATLYSGKGLDITFIDNYKLFGLGQLYTAVTKKLLMFGTGQEGKTMGLAPYGRDCPGPVLDIDAKHRGMETDYSRFMTRAPESAFLQKDLKPCLNSDQVMEPYWARMAFEVQEEVEKAILHLAKYAFEKTGQRKLCLAGGVALNCVTNSIVLDADFVDQIFVQPASSDSGIPLGLAMLGYYQKAATKTAFSFPHAFTGRSYSAGEIDGLLARFEIPHRKVDEAEVARLISQGKIVGWFTGGSEYGPRALGHRSILADPANTHMRDIINAKVKHREAFRPFAPSVLAEHADEYFELNGHPSPFMLLAPKVKPGREKVIPSVVHVDNTARVQTVAAESNPAYYRLIKGLQDLTGVPVVLNTSFNDNGEPIVETPLDALLCFMRTNIDYLVLEGVLVDKAALEPRKSQLVHQLEAHRDAVLQAEYREAIQTCCKGYDAQEMVAYLLQESAKSQYHAHHATLDKLEDKLTAWAEAKTPVAVVCDEEHQAVLSRIFEFKRINLAGLVLISDDFKAVDELEPSRLPPCQGILVFTFNTCFTLREKLAAGFGGEVFNPYGLFARRVTERALIPTPEGKPNSFTHLETLSFESQRSKDWDQFHETARKRLGDAREENLPAKPMG